MNADAIVLSLLALVDLGLLVELRLRRRKRMKEQRIARSLQLAIQRENVCTETAPQRGSLRRAS